jgi:hypothetical protein
MHNREAPGARPWTRDREARPYAQPRERAARPYTQPPEHAVRVILIITWILNKLGRYLGTNFPRSSKQRAKKFPEGRTQLVLPMMKNLTKCFCFYFLLPLSCVQGTHHNIAVRYHKVLPRCSANFIWFLDIAVRCTFPRLCALY